MYIFMCIYICIELYIYVCINICSYRIYLLGVNYHNAIDFKGFTGRKSKRGGCVDAREV